MNLMLFVIQRIVEVINKILLIILSHQNVEENCKLFN